MFPLGRSIFCHNFYLGIAWKFRQWTWRMLFNFASLFSSSFHLIFFLFDAFLSLLQIGEIQYDIRYKYKKNLDYSFVIFLIFELILSTICLLTFPSQMTIFSESVNSKIRKMTNLNQWKNTSDVINWFTNIPDMQVKRRKKVTRKTIHFINHYF